VRTLAPASGRCWGKGSSDRIGLEPERNQQLTCKTQRFTLSPSQKRSAWFEKYDCTFGKHEIPFKLKFERTFGVPERYAWPHPPNSIEPFYESWMVAKCILQNPPVTMLKMEQTRRNLNLRVRQSVEKGVWRIEMSIGGIS